MADADGADVALDELVHLMSEAASAYIGGEMKRYFDLMNHADDFTLMGPFGGGDDSRIGRLRGAHRRARTPLQGR
jgi:hypothetical protein